MDILHDWGVAFSFSLSLSLLGLALGCTKSRGMFLSCDVAMPLSVLWCRKRSLAPCRARLSFNRTLSCCPFDPIPTSQLTHT